MVATSLDEDNNGFVGGSLKPEYYAVYAKIFCEIHIQNNEKPKELPLMLLHTKRTIGNNPKYMLMIAFASG
jgi:hypothetical protein